FKFRFLRDEFNKNVAILSGGIAVSQLIPILVSPALTRLYSPQDFGILAIFVSITTILSVIANGRYELAVMLPEKDDDAINIAAVAFIVNVIFSFFCLFLIIFFKSHLLRILKMESMGIWAYFIPLTSFFIALFNLLNYTNNRFKLYRDIAKSNIYKSISYALVKLILGFFKTGAGGLIIGQITSQFVANSKLFDNIKKTGLLASISLRQIKELAKLYSNFPTFSVLAGLINTLAYQLTNILIRCFLWRVDLRSILPFPDDPWTSPFVHWNRRFPGFLPACSIRTKSQFHYKINFQINPKKASLHWASCLHFDFYSIYTSFYPGIWAKMV
ncbi:MAG: oligosaccharide flippase family protein, partial [candidate division WOR-3 bacterium]